jgi:hypothetical protein
MRGDGENIMFPISTVGPKDGVVGVGSLGGAGRACCMGDGSGATAGTVRYGWASVKCITGVLPLGGVEGTAADAADMGDVGVPPKGRKKPAELYGLFCFTGVSCALCAAAAGAPEYTSSSSVRRSERVLTWPGFGAAGSMNERRGEGSEFGRG